LRAAAAGCEAGNKVSDPRTGDLLSATSSPG
jgi:hypothetical protein